MLVGIQWSGKWTQARKIIEKFGYKLFDTWAELRKIATTETELWKNVRELIENWKQVPAIYLRDTIADFIDTNKDFPILFDGPIRSKEQDDIIRPILWKCLIIQLVLDENIAIERLIHRRIDPETGETFPENFIGNINPKTGNLLIKRKDDTEEFIKNRIKWSIEESLPLINTWENDWYTVYRIDANKDMETIFQEINQIITN